MKIIKMLCCMWGFINIAAACEIDSDASKIGQTSAMVARDVYKEAVESDKIRINSRENIVYAQATEDGLTIVINWKHTVTYKDIIDAWDRNQSFIYTSFAAISAAFFYHVRLHKA